MDNCLRVTNTDFEIKNNYAGHSSFLAGETPTGCWASRLASRLPVSRLALSPQPSQLDTNHLQSRSWVAHAGCCSQLGLLSIFTVAGLIGTIMPMISLARWPLAFLLEGFALTVGLPLADPKGGPCLLPASCPDPKGVPPLPLASCFGLCLSTLRKTFWHHVYF